MPCTTSFPDTSRGRSCPPRIEDGGWDLRNHNPLDIVPDDAKMRVLKPHSNGGAQRESNACGKTLRLEIPFDSGCTTRTERPRQADVYRISIGGKYQDEAGNLYHRQVRNPNSPHHNTDAANSTHVPWPSQYPLPY
ncbi:polymorphic toxin type 30 domain-containing protein [Streptomyces sp. NPDC048445]|uniref:polymorphic toxin type 30 domain-containing protein n=1 Tax=Streptomyces sp. NPDC048445 TaxID=3365553 RepID=UPI0037157448